MERSFSGVLSELRRAKGLSQRKAAGDLNISQALLSHYENSAREPGLGFVIRACDYYGVTADYLLGRTDEHGGPNTSALIKEFAQELRVMADRAELIAEGKGK